MTELISLIVIKLDMSKAVLNKANRSSGDWLPGVEECSKRARPCGNPHCADEAMRSRGISQSSPYGSEEAYKHAVSIVKGCGDAGCPIRKLGNPDEVLAELAGRGRT